MIAGSIPQPTLLSTFYLNVPKASLLQVWLCCADVIVSCSQGFFKLRLGCTCTLIIFTCTMCTIFYCSENVPKLWVNIMQFKCTFCRNHLKKSCHYYVLSRVTLPVITVHWLFCFFKNWDACTGRCQIQGDSQKLSKWRYIINLKYKIMKF